MCTIALTGRLVYVRNLTRYRALGGKRRCASIIYGSTGTSHADSFYLQGISSMLGLVGTG